MLENRKKPRRDLVRSVKVLTIDNAAAPSEYTLLDISETGARLRAGDLSKMPNEFYLVLREDLTRCCRVAWRNKTQAGVRFVKEPGAR